MEGVGEKSDEADHVPAVKGPGGTIERRVAGSSRRERTRIATITGVHGLLAGHCTDTPVAGERDQGETEDRCIRFPFCLITRAPLAETGRSADEADGSTRTTVPE